MGNWFTEALWRREMEMLRPTFDKLYPRFTLGNPLLRFLPYSHTFSITEEELMSEKVYIVINSWTELRSGRSYEVRVGGSWFAYALESYNHASVRFRLIRPVSSDNEYLPSEISMHGMQINGIVREITTAYVSVTRERDDLRTKLAEEQAARSTLRDEGRRVVAERDDLKRQLVGLEDSDAVKCLRVDLIETRRIAGERRDALDAANRELSQARRALADIRQAMTYAPQVKS